MADDCCTSGDGRWPRRCDFLIRQRQSLPRRQAATRMRLAAVTGACPASMASIRVTSACFGR